MSLRAVGEGHISSILFRCGVVGPDGEVTVDKDGEFFESGTVTRSTGTAYELSFDRKLPLSGRVIFPATEDERLGIEDARFVQFNGETTRYCATVTACNSSGIVQKLIETDDFEQFRVTRLTGVCAGNKGMALFPEKIDERYAMISRHDNESLFIAFSDEIYTWENPKLLMEPKEPWELTQIGNCGSPVKTDRGRLLLTHGVGPVRRYCMGAVLLDLSDPSRVIAALPTPLLCPSEDGRNGYVPNVVYSCGALVHSGSLIVPYAVSDSSSRIYTVNLNELIDRMEPM
ncbi:MAG: glycosidase [Spirochaetia bacterium]